MLFTEFDMDVALQVRAEEREKETRYQIAANFLGIVDDETIAEKTGLSITEVVELKKTAILMNP